MQTPSCHAPADLQDKGKPTGPGNTQENCSTSAPGCAPGRGAGHPTPNQPPRRVPFCQRQRWERLEALSITQCGLEAPGVELRHPFKNPKTPKRPAPGSGRSPASICKLAARRSQWGSRGRGHGGTCPGMCARGLPGRTRVSRGGSGQCGDPGGGTGGTGDWQGPGDG